MQMRAPRQSTPKTTPQMTPAFPRAPAMTWYLRLLDTAMYNPYAPLVASTSCAALGGMKEGSASWRSWMRLLVIPTPGGSEGGRGCGGEQWEAVWRSEDDTDGDSLTGIEGRMGKGKLPT